MTESSFLKALETGLSWLYRTEQPPGGVITHHGIITGALNDRRYTFVPCGPKDLPLVIVNVVRREYDENGFLLSALDENELEELTAILRMMGSFYGYPVVERWNGHPFETGTVQLGSPVHPTLLAAVNTYRAGCPAHPDAGVLCACGWYRDGYQRMTIPDFGGFDSASTHHRVPVAAH
ncbi:hypothetical protein [Amycolatopsis sp. DSM 110486]|uniref:hypothetical protein n=1 Tax=Amycolatopsis sp. DSM 110486 TaxID=2865832 RepID=UPI001C6A1024|nr:hypothetical protein [Amycolatopsis sp. DSM 110486]QYN17530.1 hypothetical protein K1T34_32615 [Amycolatopsis sp. DSM 110486]